MSFTSEFETLLNEKRKKAQSKIGLFNAYSRELAAKQATPATTQITVGGKTMEVPTKGTLRGHSYDLSNPEGAGGGTEIFQEPESGNVFEIILGTAGDAGVNFGKGFTGFSEGIADWIGHNMIYPFARATGQTENDLEWYRRYLNKSTTQKWFDGVDAALDKNSVLGPTSDAVMQGIGQFIPMVAGGKVLQAAGVGATAANLVVKGMMGVSAMGSAQSEAYAGGATDGEALAYGAASAGSELLFESLFGGMGKALNMVGFSKGLSSLDDIAAKGISKFISSPAGKNVAQMLVKGGFEGLEEVGTGFAQAVAKKLTYMSEEEFGKILKDENLFEQFIVGALVSDIAQAGDVRTANKTGTDLVTGFTKNEQAVVDKEVENRIAQEEKGGKKLSGKEKNAIYEKVVQDMEKGYISTDTIEEVLGGDSYKAYRDSLASEEAINKEFGELKGKQDATLEEQARFREVRREYYRNQAKPKSAEAKTNLRKTVSDLVKNDRLSESYNERTRSGQKFQADVTKYTNPAARKTVQNAIDNGVNNTNKAHDLVEALARLSEQTGVSYDFTDNQRLKDAGYTVDGAVVNGYVTKNGITINLNSHKALNRVVGHEITHLLEGTAEYEALKQAMKDYVNLKGKKIWDKMLARTKETYKNIKDANIENELLADLVGDYLFTDKAFVEGLTMEQPGLAKRIYNRVKQLCKIFTGTREGRQLEKVKQTFAEAFRAMKNPTAEGGVRYSVSGQYDYSKSFSEQLEDYQKGQFPKGDTMLVGATPEVFRKIGMAALPVTLNTTHVDYALNGTKDFDHHLGKALLEQLPEAIKRPVAIMTSGTKANSSIVAMLEIRHNGKQIVVPVAVDGFGKQNGILIDSNAITSVYGKNYSISKVLHDAIVQEGNGQFRLYYLDKNKATVLLQKARVPMPKNSATHNGGFIHSLTDPGSPVKSVISNVTQSQQFKRWFGDWQNNPQAASKVVNNDGTPKVMYHGSPEQFTIFDRSKAKSSGLYGKGFYFTDSKDQAGVYGNQYSVYLNVKHPLQYGGETVSRAQVHSFLEAVAENEDYSIENYGTYDVGTILDAIMEQNKAVDAFQAIQDINATAIGDLVEATELFNQVNGTKFDGIVVPTETVVFRPEQIKSATDNIGTFDGNNPDIRYSLSKKDSDIAPPVGADVYGRDIAAHPDDWIPIRKDIPRKAESGVPPQNTNAVSKPLSSYSAEKQKSIKAYLNAVDESIKKFAQRVKSGDLSFERQKISDVSRRASDDIGDLLGIDVSGYTHNINTSGIRHILNRHGATGKQDVSMSMDEDIARVGWVLENYDSVELLMKNGQQLYSSEFKDKNGAGVPQIRFVKKIDGTYYVVEAACENEYKKLWVQSAYLQKNEDVTQVSAEDQMANHKTYAQSELASPSSNNSIPNSTPVVNPEDSTGAAPSGFDPVSHLQYEYGSLPEGEKPVREDSLPKSTNGKDKVSLTGRTVKGAEATPDALVDLLDKTVVEGGLSYIPLSNDATVQKAYDRIKELGWKEALEDWKADVRAGMVSAELSATGALLLNNAANAGDRAVWLDILHEYQRMGTSAAQAVQALRILKTLAPEDKLYMIHKSVDQMNKDNEYDVEVDEELLHEWDEAETDEERDEVLDAIMQNVADQIPATFMEKFTALRYVNMLGNLRTQVRNVAGNLSMKGVRSIHNTIATALEAIVNTVSGGKTGRTRAVTVSKEQKAAAKRDFEKLKSVILDGGKYSDSVDASTEFAKGVQEKRRMFKFKPLEGYRKATNWAMEQGDLIFARDAYARALAGYLKANGITETDYSKIDTKVLEDARLFAIKEAQEATFRDTNALSGWISKIGRRRDTHKVGKLISEGVMPFRKTPANVLIRAEEYSPLGIVNSVYYSVKAMQKESDVTATQVINSWAKSLTGTGLFALGMLLQSIGCLVGGADDDESKDKFESLNGWQNYAIVLPDGTNLTIDFLTPTAMPMLMGAELSQLMADDGFEVKDLESALTSITEPMVQMSMLQGINDTLDNVKYSDNSLMQMAINSGLSYVTQGLTNTLLGQVERSFEDSRATTYVDKNSAIPDWLQRTIGKTTAKMPGLDYNQIPYINAWGEEEEYGNVAENLADNMLSPSYVDKGEEDAVSKELLRLNEVQSKNVFPNTPEKSLSFTDVNKKVHTDYQLSAEEYVALAKTQGKMQRELVEEAISNKLYGKLTDTEKAKVIENIYKYAKEYARGEVIEGYADDYGCFSTKWMSKIRGNVAYEIISHVYDQRI